MASRAKMYMGTRHRAAWVPAPAPGGNWGEIGFSTRQQYLNGGTYLRRSKAAHKEYELSWNPTARADLRPITDMASGLWGDGLIYFLDPMAIDQNLLPQFMASPMLAAYDGLPLLDDDAPALLTTGVTSLDYPVKEAQYGVGNFRRTVYIPIPAGYSAWVGVHSSYTTGGSLGVTPILFDGNVEDDVSIPKLDINDVVRVNTPFNGDTYRGIELYAQDNATYAGAMVQVFKNGINPPTGDFVSGQGNSGCEFAETPMLTAYNAPLDRVGMTASLVEVGAWQ